MWQIHQWWPATIRILALFILITHGIMVHYFHYAMSMYTMWLTWLSLSFLHPGYKERHWQHICRQKSVPILRGTQCIQMYRWLILNIATIFTQASKEASLPVFPSLFYPSLALSIYQSITFSISTYSLYPFSLLLHNVSTGYTVPKTALSENICNWIPLESWALLMEGGM